MTRQSYLVRMDYVDKIIHKRLAESRNFNNILILTHKNKGKVYPYASERQNNRKKFIRYPI